jgi:hypothetical protein
MKRLTTSVYTFANLIEGGFQYVDKTAGIHRLLAPASAQYFIARPRRFGKSLLVSTLKAIFRGRRELFEGLAIDRGGYGWPVHPVIHLDLGDRPASSAAELEMSLARAVDEQAAAHRIAVSAPGASLRFRELVLALAARDGRVVILVDEYDKPLLGALGDEGKARELLPVLKGFYAVVKATEAQQRFVLLTGVSRFSKVSVFSDLNNLTDLTMARDCATLLGYTQAELEANFGEYVERLAAREGTSRAAALERVRDWYNGYRFEETAERVYNPVSVMRCLQEEKFRNYWFETGTPTFLLELLKARRYDLASLSTEEVSPLAFSQYEVESIEPVPLLFQTGYLTIAGTRQEGETTAFRLDYPNREVRQAFGTYLLTAYGGLALATTEGALFALLRQLAAGDIDAVMQSLRVFFANVPYDIQLSDEKYYQSIFHVIFTLVGVRVSSEVRTNLGRIDAVVETAERVYVFEFKLAGTPEEALAQIRERGYAEKCRGGAKPVLLVGAAFDRETRNIGRWIVERVG